VSYSHAERLREIINRFQETVMKELWAWEVYEQDQWGTIGASIGEGGSILPLVTRQERIATDGFFRTLATMHKERTGLPIRLARYELQEVIETP